MAAGFTDLLNLTAGGTHRVAAEAGPGIDRGLGAKTGLAGFRLARKGDDSPADQGLLRQHILDQSANG